MDDLERMRADAHEMWARAECMQRASRAATAQHGRHMAAWMVDYVSQDPQPRPLDTDAQSQAQAPGVPDHAWVVESMDQQHSFIADGSSTWTVHARCAHCGQRAVFMAAGVPPCRPPGQGHLEAAEGAHQ